MNEQYITRESYRRFDQWLVDNPGDYEPEHLEMKYLEFENQVRAEQSDALNLFVARGEVADAYPTAGGGENE